MLIKTINIDKSKRLWFIIICALFVAFLLIAISFFGIYNANNNGSNEMKDIFDIKNYNTKYSLTIFSNKTKNSYEVEEWYLYNNEEERYRFDFTNDLQDKISYIILNNEVRINNTKEISKFDLKEYSTSDRNIFSFSTFIFLYNYIQRETSCGNIESKIVNDKIHYLIKLNENKINEVEELKFLLKEGLSLSSFEAVVDNKSKKVEQYVVLDEKENVVINVNYLKFDILDKFDEKIFANFDK